MNDEQLLRYSRHILLDDIGIEGQQRIAAARVLIIGAGGLASPAALYLGAAGVACMTLVDDDEVDLSNLQRQIAHTTARVGQPKVQSLRTAVQAINPAVRVVCHARRATAALLDQLVPQVSVVLDCTDNYATRHAVNAACVCHRVPLVSASAIGLGGQLLVVDPRDAHCPCYACVFAPEAAFAEVPCSVMGVLSAVVGIMGTMQAAEALKLMAGFGQPATARLLRFDARTLQCTSVRTSRLADCPVCGPAHRDCEQVLSPAPAAFQSVGAAPQSRAGPRSA